MSDSSKSSSDKSPSATITYDQVTAMGKLLEGRLLTVIEASFSDPVQRKAVKDLVRNSIWEIFIQLQKNILAEVQAGVYPLTITVPQKESGK